MRGNQCRFCKRKQHGNKKTWCCRARYIEEVINQPRHKKLDKQS